MTTINILKLNTIALIYQLIGVSICATGLWRFIQCLNSNNNYFLSLIMMLVGNIIAGCGSYQMFIVLNNKYKIN